MTRRQRKFLQKTSSCQCQKSWQVKIKENYVKVKEKGLALCGLWRKEKIIVNIFIIWTPAISTMQKDKAQWPQTEVQHKAICLSPLLSGAIFHFYLSVTQLGCLTPSALSLRQIMPEAWSHQSLGNNATCSTASLADLLWELNYLLWEITICKSDISSGTITCCVQRVSFI